MARRRRPVDRRPLAMPGMAWSTIAAACVVGLSAWVLLALLVRALWSRW